MPSRYPDVLLYDLKTLASAPPTLTVAGVGDLVVVFGSFADWYLAKCVGLEKNYSDLPRTLLGPLDKTFVTNAEAIEKPRPKAPNSWQSAHARRLRHLARPYQRARIGF